MGSEIVVVGSLNMDMVVSVDRKPAKGETLLGKNFFMSAGGKGANQAYAARKQGAEVSMIGKVGQDVFGDQLLRNLEEIGVDVGPIGRISEEATGIAFITLDSSGDNNIIVSPGANQRLTPEDIRRHERLIGEAKLLMVQLEIPLETVMEAVSIASRHGVKVLLDPAPAQPIPDDLLQKVDYIVPNESEISQLTGIEVRDRVSAKLAAVELQRRGVKTVFAKLGARGVVVAEATGNRYVEAFAVKAVDTTAAGDAFAGAIGASLIGGKDVWTAAKFASAVGAITVTGKGAQASIPDLAQTESFILEALLKQK
ncbi:ribokinase [Cohnella caldifontis]|uniref:ribokinase n=1 Tax=Cohnella caldifontis TaxID=3027471 RepID=UPI0023EB11B6|nr:ribokinase [Cohnella sp. YIM B05605]